MQILFKSEAIEYKIEHPALRCGIQGMDPSSRAGMTNTSMFIGEYQHNLDAKGRMAVPAKFRGKLGGGAIITRGLDRCLFIFTEKEWEVLAVKNKCIAIVASQLSCVCATHDGGSGRCGI